MASIDLDKFAGRPFSFYPPILNVKNNEWTFKKSTWSEVLVGNTRDDTQIWVPRRFLGEISQVDEPVMIVGLLHELEYRAGGLFPHKRRVVEMPQGHRPFEPPTENETTSAVRSGPSESLTEKHLTRLIVGVILVAILGSLIAILLVRNRESGGRISYETVIQTELGLTSADNYYAVVRKLGEPDEDRWKSETGEQQFRALYYPDLEVTIILMGTDRDNALYIGAKGKDWRNVHSVKLPGGGNTDSILRALPKF